MMKRNLWKAFLPLIALAVLSLPLAAGAQDGVKRPGDIEASEALTAAKKWASVVGQANISGLEELLHKDYLHIHSTALVETKVKFIEALTTGARKYDPITIEDANVRVFGDSAVVTGKFSLRAMSRGRVIEGVNRFSLVVVKTPRGMQAASFHATSIPQAK
jgi:hypothetical protein